VTSTGELAALVDRLRRDRRRDPRAGRREYSQAARELAGCCERLLAAGRAGEAVPVLRKAVERMAVALTRMDDSSGAVGADLRVMTALYARACAVAPPNPKTLAGWLVKLAYDGPGWPEVVLRDFAPALGERGLAALAALVEERAAKAAPDSWSHRFATRNLRDQLAEVSGDAGR
jgi:hypothetical protein